MRRKGKNSTTLVQAEKHVSDKYGVMGSKARTLLIAAVLLGALAPFQNCGHQPSMPEGMRRPSAENSTQKSKKADCGDFNSYTCIRHVHAPGVENMIHYLKECLPSGRTCVDVEVRQMRSTQAMPDLYYCRLESFEGNAETLEEALGLVMQSCYSNGESL